MKGVSLEFFYGGTRGPEVQKQQPPLSSHKLISHLLKITTTTTHFGIQTSLLSVLPKPDAIKAKWEPTGARTGGLEPVGQTRTVGVHVHGSLWALATPLSPDGRVSAQSTIGPMSEPQVAQSNLNTVINTPALVTAS